MISAVLAVYGFSVALLTDIEKKSETQAMRKTIYVIAILAAVFAIFVLRASFWSAFFLGVGVFAGLGINHLRRTRRGEGKK